MLDTIQSLEQELNNTDSEILSQLANQLKEHYRHHYWKIVLIGDEGEYERLNESINRLITAIDASELNDAKIELATIKTIVKDIYSL